AAIKRERYYARFHESVLDEKGRPNSVLRRKSYNGAFGCIMDGDMEIGRRKLAQVLERIMQYAPIKRMEELDGFAFDAESEFELGDKKIGQVMLELLAALRTDDDLIDHNVFRARELLGRSK